MKELLSQLNKEQIEAVETLHGPLLVIAGAGSGKTRVVTCRIANLLNNGIPADKILGLTFTNKAAGEMQERVMHLTQSRVLISTFHSLGARILRESITALGYSKNFTIYDEADVDKLLRICIGEDSSSADAKKELKAIRNMISTAKNNWRQPDDIAFGERTPGGLRFEPIYRSYLEKLKEYNAVDFDDLLFLTLRLFREHPNVLEYYQNRWSHLLIDEYQDTNEVQYKIVNYLISKSRNLCVVGDPDQSIYSWRGANVRNILEFEQDFPGARVVRLDRNYRSTNNILDAANKLISKNRRLYEKNLWSDLGSGEKITLCTADSDRAEARYIADRITFHLNHQGVSYSQMVVFYRTNAQSRAFEDHFLSRRIPYTVVGGISFYQRREIKDILALLRMVQSGTDFVSFERTINLPKRGVGPSSVEKIRLAAFQDKLSILEYCEKLISGQGLQFPIKLTVKQREGLADYVRVIRELQSLVGKESLKEIVSQAIQLSRYNSYLEEEKETLQDRKENLDALIAKAWEWERGMDEPSLEAFLEELSLKSSLDESEGKEERLSLMTIHNGKGLEYTVAFLAGMEEDLFPHINSREVSGAEEEERRLCYVGMTRAKRYLYLTNCKTRFIWGTIRSQRPSRFLFDIPREYTVRVHEAW